MWAGGELFVTLIRDEAEVVATATSYLYIIPITIGFAGMFNTANGAFNALSKPLPPLVLSLLRLLVFYIPLALLARHWFGHVGIFAAAAFTNVVLGVWAREWNRRTVIRQRQRFGGRAGMTRSMFVAVLLRDVICRMHVEPFAPMALRWTNTGDQA